MKKEFLILLAAFTLAVTFTACGDDSTTSVTNNTTQVTEAETFDDLPRCTSKKEGDTLFVVEEDANYICTEGKWLVENTEDETDSTTSSSSKKVSSSSSKKTSSSSSKKVSSSSSKITSSSGSKKVSSSSSKITSSSSSKKVSSSSSDEVTTKKPEEEFGKCDAAKADTIVKSETDKYYECDGSAWKESTASELEKTLGKLCSEKIAYKLFEYCAKESCTSEETETYQCANKKWKKLTAEELEAAKLTEELGVCNTKNAYKVKQASNETTYACINDEWKEQTDTELRELELQLGKLCSKATENDTVHFESDVYECRLLGKAGKDWYEWKKMTEIQIDTYGLKCKEENSGNVMEGASGTEYVCNYNTTFFPFMTVDSLKRIVKNSSCMGKDFETIKYKGASWSCVEKKWKFDAKAATGTLSIGTTEYNTVWIGFQNWMAENLGKDITGSATDNANGIYCYGDDKDNCSTYGALYTWDAALNICPTGWHLPDETDWEELNYFVKNEQGGNTAGLHLKSTTSWKGDGNGLDTYGFNAVPAGYFNSVDYNYARFSEDAYFWDAYSVSRTHARYEHLDYSSDIFLFGLVDKPFRLSVRCIQD